MAYIIIHVLHIGLCTGYIVILENEQVSDVISDLVLGLHIYCGAVLTFFIASSIHSRKISFSAQYSYEA